MIDIIKQDGNVITYKCRCGAKGLCTFRPPNKNAAIVLDIKCLSCFEMERITILQYDNEGERDKMMNSIENIDLSWAPFVIEELLCDEE